jgi:3-hydroxybutyryl-CoA dehydrogenase
MIKVGVLGSGSMGSGIAQVAATAGHNVVLVDNNPEALNSAKSKLQKIMNRLIEKGRLDAQNAADIQERISYELSMDAFASCGLVIEAIIEDLDIKKTVFRRLEEIVSSDCLIASNTSSLSISAIGSALEKANRFLGIHFFNPAPLMKLVEIIPALQTSDSNLTLARETINSWSKITVLAKDTPGFIVNRIARPFYSEALRMYDEGIADFATIDWALTEIAGFRMGPFTLMDYIGNDINYKVTETVYASFFYDGRFMPSFTQKRLADSGYYGRKAGRGYYDYSEGAEMPLANKDMDLGKQIADRVVVMLINLAADTLFMQVANESDIDLAMTKGVNYPKGLLAWANELGLQNCVDQLDALYDEYREERYRCCPLLRRMARDGQTFFNK